MRKYEFTDNEKEYEQTTFRQIRALTDIPLHGVKAGDLGGWIEEELNLSHEGSCWIGSKSFVLRNASVSGNAKVHGESIVDFRSKITGDAVVHNSVVHGINFIGGRSEVTDSDIRGHCTINQNTRIKSSKVEGLLVKGDVLVENSHCFTRLGQLTMEQGCILKGTELHLLDDSPYLAQNTELVNVKALDVELFRIFDRDITLKDEKFSKRKRIRIGTENNIIHSF